MQYHFSREPPLYARPKQPPQPTTNPSATLNALVPSTSHSPPVPHRRGSDRPPISLLRPRVSRLSHNEVYFKLFSGGRKPCISPSPPFPASGPPPGCWSK